MTFHCQWDQSCVSLLFHLYSLLYNLLKIIATKLSTNFYNVSKKYVLADSKKVPKKVHLEKF